MKKSYIRKVYLIGRTGVYAGMQLLLEGEIVIGRDSRICQLVYPAEEKKISGVHCKLYEKDGNICLLDMNSTNGTFFEDGTRLEPSMPRMIDDGQGFYLGSRENAFDIKVEMASEVAKSNRNKNEQIQYNAERPKAYQEQPIYNVEPQRIVFEQPKRRGGGIGVFIAVIVTIIALGVAGVFAYQIYTEYEKENSNPWESTINAAEDWYNELF